MTWSCGFGAFSLRKELIVGKIGLKELLLSIRKKSVLSGAVASLAMLSAGQSVQAASLTFAGSGVLTETNPTGQLGTALGLPVSASVQFSVSGGFLNVTLANTITAGNLKSAEQALDQVVFDFGDGSGLKLTTATSGSTNGDFLNNGSVTSGSLANYATSGLTSVSGNLNTLWGGGAFGSTTDTGLTLHPNKTYDILQLADEVNNKNGSSFEAFSGAGLLNQVKDGVLPNVVPSLSDNFVGFNPFVVGSISFQLAITNTNNLTSDQILASISNVQFVFDDKDPPTVVRASPVPLPESVWSGMSVLTLIGFGVAFKRRKAARMA
jgi:hypothetical protein